MKVWLRPSQIAREPQPFVHLRFRCLLQGTWVWVEKLGPERLFFSHDGRGIMLQYQKERGDQGVWYVACCSVNVPVSLAFSFDAAYPVRFQPSEAFVCLLTVRDFSHSSNVKVHSTPVLAPTMESCFWQNRDNAQTVLVFPMSMNY
ncbi:uncharacterized protein LY79DRAFT_538971 [Colletotrichum navitas]|uniref:Uncharacterized protein n=1 Tax=Colletotrichum navitas TaxID=681940 RepID=A0AAD8QCE5_9PEZI|nr:uncharacterized protein LY79DRAFT_538971 [Colletotrichum navitas]KAK1598364.1 hypothetical protein LY79DRAFT_538971 [Colletotrichum navitas]